jgi:glycine betaine/proline transport system substrate-binding protein
MMKSKPYKFLSTLLAAAVAVGFSGCQPSQQDATTPSVETPESKTANLAYVNWAEGVAYTHLAKVVLEEKLGYQVNLTMADVGPAYMAVANGNQDAFMECWPDIHQDYLNEVGDKLIDLGVVYEGTALGLVVPSYVTIDRISELNAHKDKFKGVITGVDSGAGMMRQTAEYIIPEYELELKLVPSSGPAMTAALSAAIDAGEWIVVTGWRPHWKFGRWDLKLLQQEPDKTVWEDGSIHIMGRVDIDQDKPALAAFLRKMQLTDPELSDLMVKIEDSEYSVEEVAREWMYSNPSAIEAWLP